jgi:hypothetical protein
MPIKPTVVICGAISDAKRSGVSAMGVGVVGAVKSLVAVAFLNDLP